MKKTELMEMKTRLQELIDKQEGARKFGYKLPAHELMAIEVLMTAIEIEERINAEERTNEKQ